MANLANIYALIRRNYGEHLLISYSPAPSYLKRIIGTAKSCEKIILISDLDRYMRKDFDDVSPSKLHIKSENDLNLTGSPLKDECLVDAIGDVSLDLKMAAANPWSIEEGYHKGIALDKARKIFCDPEFQRSESARTSHGSVWILCNGNDKEKTILFEYEFVKGFNSRGLITYAGVVFTNAVSAQDILRQHYSIMNSDCKVDTYIENIYYIKSHISLKCSWSTAAAVPNLIDLGSCDVTLTQTFRLSECNPSSEEFMNQLRILMIIRDDIIAYRDEEKQVGAGGTGKDPVYRCGRGVDMEDLRESVNKVMTEISGYIEVDDGNLVECDLEAVVQRARSRRITDLTDKLWNIIKCCSSYKDLKTAFNIVFQCAARCNIVNTPTNKNRLAEIITEVSNRRLAIPCLSGSEPLELLLEIGMEKLYKDYEFIFSESKICSPKDMRNIGTSENINESEAPLNVRKSLRNAMRPEVATQRKTLLHTNVKAEDKPNSDTGGSFKNSTFNGTESIRQLSKLFQIHCTLEHLLMIQINLNLTNVQRDVCDQSWKKPTRIVNSIDDSVVDEMEITLSPYDIQEHLQGKDPHARRIVMESCNTFRNVKTTFFYSMDNVFPPGISECFQNEDKECVKNNFYYCWIYRKIKTVCPTKLKA